MQNSNFKKYLILIFLISFVHISSFACDDPEIYAKSENETLRFDTDSVVFDFIVSDSVFSNHSFINIKTNTLFLAGFVMNLGTEVRLSTQYSIDLIAYWSPYNMFQPNRKIRVLGIQPELRYWWGDPLKSGHFIGLHGQITGFNIQLNDKNRYQDPNRPLWGMGLSYGYLLQFGKNSRWGVEFVLGLGYANLKYDVYDGAKNGQFIRSEAHGYWGITRMGIDLCFRFNCNKRIRKI